MNSIESLHLEIALVICVWALLVVASVITATWKKRELPQTQEASPIRTKPAAAWCRRTAEVQSRTSPSARPTGRGLLVFPISPDNKSNSLEDYTKGNSAQPGGSSPSKPTWKDT
jgi:hypothetical protein